MKIQAYTRWLWDASLGIRCRIAMSSAWGMGYVCASLGFIWVCKRLVDIATDKAEGNVWHYITWLALCIAVQLVCAAAGIRLDTLNTVRLKNSLRYRLFTRVMESRLSEKKQFHTGDVINRMEEDTRLVTEALCTSLPSVIVTLVQLAAAFFFLLMMEPVLAAILVAIMPVSLLMSKLYLRRMRCLTREIRTTEGIIQSHVQERLQYRTLIRTLEHTPQTLSTLGYLQDSLHRQVTRRTDFTLFSRTVVQSGFALGYAIAFLWGIHGLMEGMVTFGMMTAFLQLVGQVQRPIVELSRYIPSLIHSVTSVERLAELNALPVEEQGVAISLSQPTGIRLENTCFAYPDGRHQVISGFTHDFRPGSFTALTGETGAGKSTLIHLMLALLTPNEGNIILYGGGQETPVSPSTRRNFVYVPQGNTLLSGTVRQNLLLGNPDATETELREALHTAAAEFIFSLPDGMDTRCGEGGTGLSEGQAQRIAIARGLLRPGGILLLDEPSSSLDEQTEYTLLHRLATYAQSKTVILVTHRPQVADICGETVRIEK